MQCVPGLGLEETEGILTLTCPRVKITPLRESSQPSHGKEYRFAFHQENNQRKWSESWLFSPILFQRHKYQGKNIATERKETPLKTRQGVLFMTLQQQTTQETPTESQLLGLQDGFMSRHFICHRKDVQPKDRGSSIGRGKLFWGVRFWRSLASQRYQREKLEGTPGQLSVNFEDISESVFMHLDFTWEQHWKLGEVRSVVKIFLKTTLCSELLWGRRTDRCRKDTTFTGVWRTRDREKLSFYWATEAWLSLFWRWIPSAGAVAIPSVAVKGCKEAVGNTSVWWSLRELRQKFRWWIKEEIVRSSSLGKGRWGGRSISRPRITEAVYTRLCC